MRTDILFDLFERVGTLLRSEERAAGLKHGLQPVHLAALTYLSRCNRLSDSPAGVTEFLGLTKGTVSQTLGLLEKKKLIRKIPDPLDGRKVHIELTTRGEKILGTARPPALFRRAAERPGQELATLGLLLEEFLAAMQREGESRTFGACETCRHLERKAGGKLRCGFTGEALKRTETERICREHELELV